MKKKENLWELLERLDREAGQFNVHLSEANRYFDSATEKTQSLLARQEKELHATIGRVKRALKRFKQNSKKNKPGKSNSSQ